MSFVRVLGINLESHTRLPSKRAERRPPARAGMKTTCLAPRVSLFARAAELLAPANVSQGENDEKPRGAKSQIARAFDTPARDVISRSRL